MNVSSSSAAPINDNSTPTCLLQCCVQYNIAATQIQVWGVKFQKQWWDWRRRMRGGVIRVTSFKIAIWFVTELEKGSIASRVTRLDIEFVDHTGRWEGSRIARLLKDIACPTMWHVDVLIGRNMQKEDHLGIVFCLLPLNRLTAWLKRNFRGTLTPF